MTTTPKPDFSMRGPLQALSEATNIPLRWLAVAIGTSCTVLIGAISFTFWLTMVLSDIKNELVSIRKDLAAQINSVKRDVARMEETRWSRFHQEMWSNTLRLNNKSVVVPETQETIRKMKELDGK